MAVQLRRRRDLVAQRGAGLRGRYVGNSVLCAAAVAASTDMRGRVSEGESEGGRHGMTGQNFSVPKVPNRNF